MRSAATYVKVEIPVLLKSQKSRVLSSTSFQMDKTFRVEASAAVEQLRRKANMVVKGFWSQPMRLTSESL